MFTSLCTSSRTRLAPEGLRDRGCSVLLLLLARHVSHLFGFSAGGRLLLEGIEPP